MFMWNVQLMHQNVLWKVFGCNLMLSPFRYDLNGNGMSAKIITRHANASICQNTSISMTKKHSRLHIHSENWRALGKHSAKYVRSNQYLDVIVGWFITIINCILPSLVRCWIYAINFISVLNSTLFIDALLRWITTLPISKQLLQITQDQTIFSLKFNIESVDNMNFTKKKWVSSTWKKFFLCQNFLSGCLKMILNGK